MSICHSLKSGAETRSMPGGSDCWIFISSLPRRLDANMVDRYAG